MCKAIVKRCNTCEGRHVINHTEKCWDCRGSGKQWKKLRKKCKDCNGTGRYVRKLGRHKHKVTPCRRCEEGKVTVWVKTKKPCRTCQGSGKYHKRIRCPKCKGDGKTTINSMDMFLPKDLKKKLELA